jgi:hypothetical protein
MARPMPATHQDTIAQRKAACQPAFRPHAYLLGTDNRPSSVTIFGLTGGAERWLRIPLDALRPPVTFAMQSLAVVRRTPVVPFFGPTTGFVVNYTPDQAVRFDLDGKPVERLAHAYSPGEVTLALGKRRTTADEFGGIMGLV